MKELLEILVVDDSRMSRESLREMLQALGYQVRTAVNGQQAVDEVRRQAPDLVILDVLMPEMDGYATARALKADDNFRHIPIIIITQLASREDRLKCFLAGADEYISKPFDESELKMRLRSLLRAKVYQDELAEQAGALARANKELKAKVELQQDTWAKLSRSRRFLEQVLHHVQEPIFVKDLRHRYLMVNQAYCDLVGASEEALLGATDYDHFPADFARRRWESDKIALADQGPASYEHAFEGDDGVARYVRVTKSRLESENGPVVVGTVRDLTIARHARQEHLKRIRYQAVFEHLAIPLRIYLPDGGLVAANRAALETSYGREESQPGVYNLLQDREAGHDGRKALFQQALFGRVSSMAPRQVGRPDKPGHGKWIRTGFFPLPGEEGGIAYVCEACLDLTDLVEAERALRASESLLNDAQALAGLGAWDWDFDSGQVYCTKQVLQMLGHDSEAPLTKEQALRFVHPAHLPMLKQAVEKARDRGEPFDLEVKLTTSRGTLLWSRILGRAELDNGQTVKLVGVVQDITQKRRWETEMAAAKQAALAAEQAKNQFLANVSHELRTPLNAIMGMSGLLLGGELDPEQREEAENVSAAADRLLLLVNDILNLSQMEDGKSQLCQRAFSLRSLLEEVTMQMQEPARAKGLMLSLRLAPDAPDNLLGDQVKLKQILLRLLGNAVRFTEQGRVELDLGLAARQGDQVVLRFAVHDSGPGISQDKQSLIFDRFSQADGSHARKHQGAGLGLHIASRMANLLGGRMWVESEPGRGSSFYFTVQMKTAPRGRGKSAAPAQTALAARPLLVLVAEVNLVNMRFLETLLGKRGHKVLLVDNGQAAVDTAREKNPDLILMAPQLPALDGLAAAAAIRKNPGEHGRRVPILALYSPGEESEADKLTRAGMDGWVGKPENLDELVATLENAAATGIG